MGVFSIAPHRYWFASRFASHRFRRPDGKTDNLTIRFYRIRRTYRVSELFKDAELFYNKTRARVTLVVKDTKGGRFAAVIIVACKLSLSTPIDNSRTKVSGGAAGAPDECGHRRASDGYRGRRRCRGVGGRIISCCVQCTGVFAGCKIKRKPMLLCCGSFFFLEGGNFFSRINILLVKRTTLDIFFM